MEEIKYMDIKELVEKGYLQEANRQFFHPLGLALAVSYDEQSKSYTLAGVIDKRDSEIYYDLENSNLQRIMVFNQKKEYIEEQKQIHAEHREKKLGFSLEPVK